jgi:hypothetical protein
VRAQLATMQRQVAEERAAVSQMKRQSVQVRGGRVFLLSSCCGAGGV